MGLLRLQGFRGFEFVVSAEDAVLILTVRGA